MTKRSRVLFFLCLVAALGAGAYSLYSLATGGADTGKWIGTTGVLLGLSGAFHLEVTGFLDRAIELISDEDAYPYGPPSYITRELIAIESADDGLLRRAFGYLLTNRKLGYWLVISGSALGLPAIWI